MPRNIVYSSAIQKSSRSSKRCADVVRKDVLHVKITLLYICVKVEYCCEFGMKTYPCFSDSRFPPPNTDERDVRMMQHS